MTDNTLTIKETHYLNGQIRTRDCRNAQGQLHNPTDPAYESWFSDGQLSYQQFWLNGKLHNPAGPANQSWLENGELDYQEFFLNGEEFVEEAPIIPSVFINGTTFYKK